MSSSDLTFFTNEPNSTLLDRFMTTLKDTQLFDVIVEYFLASGFYQLQASQLPGRQNTGRVRSGDGLRFALSAP